MVTETTKYQFDNKKEQEKQGYKERGCIMIANICVLYMSKSLRTGKNHALGLECGVRPKA